VNDNTLSAALTGMAWPFSGLLQPLIAHYHPAMQKPTTLFLLAASPAVFAQAWQGDLEFGQDATGLALVILAAVGFVIVRDAYRTGQARGHRALAICIGVAIAGMLFTPVAWLLSVAALIAFLVMAWHGFMGR